MGSRQVAVTRELTKLHQEAVRGTAPKLIDEIEARGGVKGEITLVICTARQRRTRICCRCCRPVARVAGNPSCQQGCRSFGT
jgi:16S rRNA C1402 (ribose-2'-O) methylase RsmI